MKKQDWHEGQPQQPRVALARVLTNFSGEYSFQAQQAHTNDQAVLLCGKGGQLTCAALVFDVVYGCRFAVGQLAAQWWLSRCGLSPETATFAADKIKPEHRISSLSQPC